MPDEPRELAPLMESIEQLLAAIDSQPLNTLQAAVEELRGQFLAYDECCCRRAHVVPFDDAGFKKTGL